MRDEQISFTICNHVSTSLNLLLFIRNIFKNKHENNTRFPDIYGLNDPEISYDEFQITFNKLWASVLAEFQEGQFNDNQFVMQHIREFLSNAFPRQYEMILHAFYNWWWSQPVGGYAALEAISDWSLDYIWTNVRDQLKNIPAQNLAVKRHEIVLTYDEPENTVETSFARFSIQSIGRFIPILSIEEISSTIVYGLSRE